MKKGFFLFVILFFCIGVGKAVYYLKDGFSPRRVQSISLWTSDQFDEEVYAALTQEFHYLGRGRQCFAFESKDGKYVLKFPRTDIFKTPFWVRALPLRGYRSKLEASHREKEGFIIESFQISAEELRQQTGTLAIHLGQSPLKIKCKVIDALGCPHILSLGKSSFVLQHKHPLLIKNFLSALKKGDRKEAERILDALVDLIAERASKGILNRDRSFLRNYGFDGERAYQIDIGSFFRKKGLDLLAARDKSFFDSIDPVQEWLAKTDREMLLYLNSKIKNTIKSN